MAPLGYQQITASALATAQSLIVPVGAQVALISVDSAPVRWRDDGVSPTTSMGVALTNGLLPFEYSGNLQKIQFIAESGSPVLNISYYHIDG
jgi:hypothetical protein